MSRLAPLAIAAALALCLAACGGAGGSSAGSSSEPASASAQEATPHQRADRQGSPAPLHLHRAPGTGQAGASTHFAAAACSRPASCTAASRADGTFWPSRHRSVPKRNGSVTYAPIAGEVIPQAGEMALSSPAFALNEPLPRAYSCDGAGISPPLEWKGVPAHAGALVLLAIDLSSNGRSGGIRWIVANIDPGSHGVAAGQVPAGGVVGANAEGKAAYGAICPAAGKESWVEFQLYALSQKIPLASGFQPAAAESAYANLLLGHGAATTYTLYLRH